MTDLENYEKEYEALNLYEKHIVNTTALSIDDIKYYENLATRKLSDKELMIVSLLCTHGIKLDENFLRK